MRLAILLTPLLAAASLAACSDSGGPADLLVDCDLFSPFVFDGGVGRGGIPALSDPHVASAAAATFLTPEDRILGVVRNGMARAYPLIVMWWHEVVNDTLGGEPLLVSYCPLTGSGLAHDPWVNGTLHTFLVSGLIFENNLMMVDAETESVWPQLLASARCGPRKGAALQSVAIAETTWERWLELHPATTVVTTHTGFSREYGRYPYNDYAVPANDELLFPSSPFNITRNPKEPVLGVFEGDAEVVYPYFAMRDVTLAAGVDALALNDTLASRPIVVLWDTPSQTAIAYDRRANGETLTFRASAEHAGQYEDEETGSRWSQSGVALAGPLTGVALTPIARSYTAFWFAWSIFHRFARRGIE